MTNVVDFPEQGKIEAEAAEWLILLDRDESPTPEEHRKLHDWLNASSKNRKAINDLAELWGHLNILTGLAVDLESPRAAPPLFGRFMPRLPVRNIQAVAIAASLLLVVAAGLVMRGTEVSIERTNGLYATAVGDQQLESLEDGSTVLLNTNSQIEVVYGSQYRDIYLLQGEAYFSVARDSEMPFRVFAGGGLINAVGTAFSIRLKQDEVDVLVTEGMVSLASTLSQLSTASDQHSEVSKPEVAFETLGILNAGQITTILTQQDEQANRTSSLSAIETIGLERISDRLSWREGVITFTGQTLESVVNQISRYTTVQIDLADEAMKSMRFGGKFPIGETELMLTALESNFGLKVSWLSRDHVVISEGDS